MLEQPSATAALHQPRLRFIGRGELQHRGRRERIDEGWKGAANEQRLALPMTAHEGGDVERVALAFFQNGLESIRLSSDRGCQCYR
jgi:hypothetical protein